MGQVSLCRYGDVYDDVVLQVYIYIVIIIITEVKSNGDVRAHRHCLTYALSHHVTPNYKYET